jgi:hypothetical protein
MESGQRESKLVRLNVVLLLALKSLNLMQNRAMEERLQIELQPVQHYHLSHPTKNLGAATSKPIRHSNEVDADGYQYRLKIAQQNLGLGW